MSDRAEREKQLDWLYRLKSNLKIFIPKDFHLAEFEQSLDYAISSIKTDLKYDLLYEETNHIANVSKKIESTPDDCETCIHNKGVLECDIYGCKYEPTTKNCRTCRNFGSHHGICEICKDNKCWTEKEPIADNDSAVDCIVDVLGSYTDLDIPYKREIAENILTKLSSVTPQPKRGIWQQTNKNEVNVIPEYKCSECGAEYKGFNFDFDYCPRCGCAMEEEE